MINGAVSIYENLQQITAIVLLKKGVEIRYFFGEGLLLDKVCNKAII